MQQRPHSTQPLQLRGVPPGAVFRICPCLKAAGTVWFGIRWLRQWTPIFSPMWTSIRQFWRPTLLTPPGNRPSCQPMLALRLFRAQERTNLYRSARNTSTGQLPRGQTDSALSPEIELAGTIMISRQQRRAIAGSIRDSIYWEPSIILQSVQ